MGWHFRRSKKIAPGVRLNLSRRGAGLSVGPRGLKISRGSDGRIRRTVSIPGTGLYNTSVLGSSKKRGPMPTQHTSIPGPGEPSTGTAADSTGPRAWARRHPKISTVGGVLAALLVIGSFGDGGDSDDPLATNAAAAQVAADDGAVDQAQRDEAERRAAEEAAARKAAEAEAERQAAEAARVEVERVAAEKAAAEAAAAQAAAAEAARVEAARVEAARVEAARVEAEQRAAAEEAAQAAAPPAGGTDPQFGTCKDAKANGFGPYWEDQDAEYGWYRDADSDGIVCE